MYNDLKNRMSIESNKKDEFVPYIKERDEMGYLINDN
jgi:hypothetical protein